MAVSGSLLNKQAAPSFLKNGEFEMRHQKKLYIAYGSNMNQAQMRARCPAARVLGTAMLDGCRLLFRGAHRGAVATIEPYAGASVPVVIWEITPECEAALDLYEGFPHLYEKAIVKIRLDGRPVRAMAYIMTPGKMPGQPSAYYYKVILDGYMAAGLDPGPLRQATVDSAQEYALDVNG
jgi:hypothetical protein